MGQHTAAGEADGAKNEASAQISKGAAPKISSKLMGLKFMQRAHAKKELSIHHKQAKKAEEEEHFVLEANRETGCRVIVEEETLAGSGRMSFLQFNPDVEKINEEHKKRMKQREVDEAEQDDVSANAMAEVLGKRKQEAVSSSATQPAVRQQSVRAQRNADAAAQPNPAPGLGEKKTSAIVTVNVPDRSKPSFMRASKGRTKKGRVS